MHRFARWVVAGALVAGPAAASPPDDGASLHTRALAAAKQKQWEEALALWAEANRRAPSWKYHFNRASVLAHLERWPDALAAVDASLALEPPASDVADVVQLGVRAEARLLADFALLTVTVSPPGSTLWVDDVPAAPGRQPLAPGRHGLRCGPRSVTVEARRGERLTRTLDCAAPAPGSIRIVGAPPGTRVELDGRPVGSTPAAAELPRQTGTYRLVLVAPGYERFEATIDVAAGAPSVVEPVFVRTAPTEAPRDLAPAGWATLGAGALLTIVGGGLLGYAASLNDDAGALSRATTPDYDARYDALGEEFRASLISGWTLTGVGAGALLAGAWLLIEQASE